MCYFLFELRCVYQMLFIYTNFRVITSIDLENIKAISNIKLNKNNIFFFATFLFIENQGNMCLKQ